MKPEATADWERQREIRLPFEVELDDGRCLQCSRLLRVLPGRRLAGVGVIDGQAYFFKLFLGDHPQREADADARGIQALMAAAIDTPALLEKTWTRRQSYPVLLFEYIIDARSFLLEWQQADSARRVGMRVQLLRMVAGQHQAGLYQRDFHLNNFIYDATGRLYAIDGGDYGVVPGPLGWRRSVANLGALFGHLPWSQLSARDDPLADYARLRDWPVARLYPAVQRAASRFRHRRARRISRKAFRDCSEFQRRRQGRWLIYQRRELPEPMLDQWMQATGLAPADGEPILKPGNSQTVWVTRIGAEEAVIKRYNIKSRLHGLKRALNRSRASRSWENAHRLRAYHIDTPWPLAMIEERRWGIRQRAWLITRKASGAGANQIITGVEQRQQIEALAAVVRDFFANELVHGDMKATNFIIDGDKVQVIDLDSMRRPRLGWFRRRGQQQDRQRFLRNWKDARLRACFARHLHVPGA